MDYLIIRLVTNTNENYASLEQANLEYALKLHEHLDIKDAVDEDVRRKQELETKRKKF